MGACQSKPESTVSGPTQETQRTVKAFDTTPKTSQEESLPVKTPSTNDRKPKEEKSDDSCRSEAEDSCRSEAEDSCRSVDSYRSDRSYNDDSLRTRGIRRSSSLGLEDIDKDRKEAGALASNVVHIELPFGKPIEEVYDGVHTGEVLGSGVSGLVRKVKHRATGIEYAAKCLDLGLIETKEGLEQLKQEIYIMCQLDHPNIVRLEEVYESASEIYLVQELCKGGELFDRLDEQPDYHYTEQQCARLVKQMLSSVRYIHSKGIIHRDLKLENFLFSSKDESSELKMIDFGLSKHFKFGDVQHEAVGTPYTVAPEVIQGNYDERCDVWAMGVITYLLLSGDPPFGGCGGPESLLTVRNNILQGKFRFEPEEIWYNVSQQAKNFIRSLLVTDPKKRLTAREAQRSHWLKEWAVKETKANGGNQLNPNVVNALVTFKEYSDMRKLLCEVLSFTLIPDQIQDLRKEFEKMDTEGSGEISLAALKKVLVESAGSGALGALTENEVEDIFNAMRVRKTDTYIHWHEFIAAGLSQCQVDDRNLRLAFDRLDSDHKGYITFDDVIAIMGNDGLNSEESYKKIFFEGLSDVQCKDSKISYEDFQLLMKGQTRDHLAILDNSDYCSMRSLFHGSSDIDQKLEVVPEIIEEAEKMNEDYDETDEKQAESPITNSPVFVRRQVPSSPLIAHNGVYVSDRRRSRSVDFDYDEEDETNSPHTFGSLDSRLGINLPEHEHHDKKIENLIMDGSKTPLVVNRNLYRAHRQMRLGVLEACKRFEEQQVFRVLQEQKQQIEAKGITGGGVGAGLVMRHGHSEQLSSDAIRTILEEREQLRRALIAKANSKSGRGRRRRIKTVSDMSGMLNNSSQNCVSTSERLLQVCQNSSFRLKAETSSCPPSPAIEAVQASPYQGSMRSIPFLPSISLDEPSPENSMGP